MTIAHLSDLHFGFSPERDALIARRIAEAAARHPDHLVITGDLSQHGHTDEFAAVHKLLLENGFDDPARLTVIPGNHDLFAFFFAEFHSGSDLYAQWRRLPATARDIFRYSWSDYAADLGRFHAAFPEAFRGILTLETTEEPSWPFIKLLPEQIALIAVESNRLLPMLRSNAACSSGQVDLESSKRILSHPALQERVRILLLHHHLVPEAPLTRAMGKVYTTMTRVVNRARFSRLLETSGITLVLHGHYHHHEHYTIGHGLTAVNSGGFGQWHLIELDGEAVTLHSCGQE